MNNQRYTTPVLSDMNITLQNKIGENYQYEFWRVFAVFSELANLSDVDRLPIVETFEINNGFYTVGIAPTPEQLIISLIMQIVDAKVDLSELYKFLVDNPHVFGIIPPLDNKDVDDNASFSSEDTETIKSEGVNPTVSDEKRQVVVSSDDHTMDSPTPKKASKKRKSSSIN